MLSVLSPRRARLLRPAAITVALLAMSATASAQLAPFTFNPGAVGLTGSSITADNILISDFSAVTFSGTTFSEVGLLAVSNFQLGGATFSPTGLNSNYGLYVAFSGNGTTTVGNPALVPTFGSFTSLDYSLFAYSGTASFGFSGNTPTTTAATPTLLASGSLLSGVASTVPFGDGSFVPTAAARLTFNVASGAQSFFQGPTPFYQIVNTAFTNPTSTVEPFANGFRIRQGGGSINFTSPIPEPSTYALLLAGLGVIGFSVSRRRRPLD